ncbi:fibroleukin-like isoform X2 [Drosophila albomicans]|uniref:Fibroleukin-like isoform X2 n=1 Tax=Drosophila albomicans TaxID=7291 RepID=A0A9C6WHE0_DROAB|nr:fibroleukin-like isoform X2 [Drosophila albomicans]
MKMFNLGNSRNYTPCEVVCARKVKEFFENSIVTRNEFEEFTKILQIKDDQIKNAEDKVTELEIKLSVYKERINIYNQKMKDKDDLIAVLSHESSSIKTKFDKLMEILIANNQTFTNNDEIVESTDNIVHEEGNISPLEITEELNNLTINDINDPLKPTIKKLEETIAFLTAKLTEKDGKLLELSEKLLKWEGRLRIAIPYGTSRQILHIPNTAPLEVVVEPFKGRGAIIIQNRLNGKFSFDRDLKDYYEGFGDIFSNFWIGLEYIHRITSSQRHVLRIDMFAYCGKKYFAEYDNFTVAGKKENYKLKSLGKYTGNADDMMRFSENQEFQVCSILKRGWWDVKNAVQHCNLNGKTSSDIKENDFEYIYWGLKDWGNTCQNISGVKMVIFPK